MISQKYGHIYRAFHHHHHDARFEIFTAVKIQVGFVWVVTLFSDVIGYQSFRGPCCLHLWRTARSSEALGTWGAEGEIWT